MGRVGASLSAEVDFGVAVAACGADHRVGLGGGLVRGGCGRQAGIWRIARIAAFAEAYRRAFNETGADATAERDRAKRDLVKVEKKMASILAAIEDGIYHPSMKEKMASLEDEKSSFACFLDTSPEPPALRLHPRLSDLYRKKIADLGEVLNQPELKPQATELLRGLLSEVRMVPAPGRPGAHEIELLGELAGILSLNEPDMTKPPRLARAGIDFARSVSLVAGTGFANCFAMSKAIIPPCPAIGA